MRPVHATPFPADRYVWLGWLLLALIWFGPLGARALIHADEGRYAVLALNMFHSGDWITPRLNGLIYFEKPPLQYWATAAAFHLFGVNEFAARFWTGLTGFLSCVMVAFTAARLWGREAGHLAGFVAAGTAWIAFNGHFVALDMGLTAFLTMALCGFLLANHPMETPRGQRVWALMMWAGMALAVLSKGLVGLVIPAATLLLYTLTSRFDFSVWKRLCWLPGLALFFVIAAPWFVLVELKNPGFAEFFFIHEHFVRYTTTVHSREGAWWYFIPQFAVGALPWLTLIPFAIWSGLRAEAGHFSPTRVVACWCAFIFLFFSASSSKLPSYILPMFPALALVLGAYLAKLDIRRFRPHLLVPALVWLAVIVLAATRIKQLTPDLPQEKAQWFALELQAAGMSFLGLTLVVAWLARRARQAAGAVMLTGVVSLFAFTLVMLGHDHYAHLKHAREIVAAARPALGDAPVFAVQTYDQTLPFYLQRNVVLVDYVDEFAYGQRAEPNAWIPTLADFASQWRTLPQAGALMSPDTFKRLSDSGLPMRVVYRDSRRLFVVKP